MGEAFLVVWSQYHHVVDQINGRHLRKSGPDYRAWCKEMYAAELDYIDGLRSIAFGSAQVQPAKDLIARAKQYEAALKECSHSSISEIVKVVPSMTKAEGLQLDAETALRIALNLPTGG